MQSRLITDVTHHQFIKKEFIKDKAVDKKLRVSFNLVSRLGREYAFY